MPSIPGQIGLLQDLRGFLSQLQTSLNNAAAGYQRRVDALHAEGLIDDFHRDLSNESLAATLQEVNQLVANIEARDIPQVQEIIGYLSSYRP
jgi:DNA-binding Lrp family transcriptional regulator